MRDQKRTIHSGEFYKACMRSSMGCSPKGFLQKIKKKKKTDKRPEYHRQRKADSSFSWQCENDVTGEETSQDEVLVEADLE